MSEQSTHKNRSLVFKLVTLVSCMLALSFASVPLYDWFCRVTGWGGVTNVAAAPSDRVLDQTVKIRFDGDGEFQRLPVFHGNLFQQDCVFLL